MGIRGRDIAPRALAVMLVAAGALIVPAGQARADHCVGRAPFAELLRQANLIVLARIEQIGEGTQPSILRPRYRYRGTSTDTVGTTVGLPSYSEPGGAIRTFFGCGIDQQAIEVGDRLLAGYWVDWGYSTFAPGWLIGPDGTIKASSVEMDDPPATFAELDARLRSALAPDTATVSDPPATGAFAGQAPVALLLVLFLIASVGFLRRFRVS